jgi:hypothetical protein
MRAPEEKEMRLGASAAGAVVAVAAAVDDAAAVAVVLVFADADAGGAVSFFPQAKTTAARERTTSTLRMRWIISVVGTDHRDRPANALHQTAYLGDDERLS